MQRMDSALVIRLCELLVNAAEVIQEQQKVILQLGGTFDGSTEGLIEEIGTMVD